MYKGIHKLPFNNMKGFTLSVISEIMEIVMG